MWTSSKSTSTPTAPSWTAQLFLSCLHLYFSAVTPAEVTQAHKRIPGMITLLSIHKFSPLKPSSLQPILVYCLAWHRRERDNAGWHLKGWFVCSMQNGNKWRSCPANNRPSDSESKTAQTIQLLVLLWVKKVQRENPKNTCFIILNIKWK